MMSRIAKITFFILLTTASSTYAELSYNPWTHPNTQQDIDQIYQEKNKKRNAEQYNFQQENFVNNPETYTSAPINNSASRQTSATPQRHENTAIRINQQPTKRITTQQNTLKERISTVNLKSLQLPRVNTRGIIRKFERASGINFKSIAKKIKHQ